MNKTLHFQNCLGVFPGGGCQGAAFIGAYKEALKRGVFFSQLSGTSVGSVFAVFIAAGATPEQLEEYVKQLDFKKFLREPQIYKKIKVHKFYNILSYCKPELHKFYNYLGVYNPSYISEWVDSNLRKLLNKKDVVLFKDLTIPTSVISTDLKSFKVKVWDKFNTPDDEVGKAVMASCSMPFIFQPVENRYVDGGVLSNLPIFIYNDKTSFDKVLAFELNSNIEEIEFNSMEDYLLSLANTVTRGSSNIYLQLQENIYLVKINTGSIKATDFNKILNKDIEFLIKQGEEGAKEFFDNEISQIQNNHPRADVCNDNFQTYNLLALTTRKTITQVLISDYSTKWAYSLFPTILSWVQSECKIAVLLKENNDDRLHGAYRKRLLEAFGVKVKIVPEISFRGFVFNATDLENAFAMVINREEDMRLFNSKFYYGREDGQILNLLKNSFFQDFSDDFNKTYCPSMENISGENLYKNLREIPQYSSSTVTFSVEEINIQNLTLLTNQIMSYKYRQIESLIQFYYKNKINLFEPSKLILQNKKETIVTPPIIEKHGSNYYVIEGNTRVTYCHKNGIKTIKVVLVNGVTDFLPSSGRFKVDKMLISDKEIQGEKRYGDFNRSLFRDIEKASRNPATCLL